MVTLVDTALVEERFNEHSESPSFIWRLPRLKIGACRVDVINGTFETNLSSPCSKPI